MPIISGQGDDSANGYGEFSTVPTLYSFPVATSFTFTSAGVTGYNGPTLSQIQSSYVATSWTQNTSYLNMTSNNGIQLWTVPANGVYRILALGASGGGNQYYGGRGIYMRGDVSLTYGQVIQILVGQGGASMSGSTTCNSGGGGGTFVVGTVNGTANQPIIVAGGGGGLGQGNGYDAVSNTTGGTSQAGTAGGSNGAGGGANQGTSGAGFSGNGQAAQWGALGGVNNGIAQAFLSGGQGGTSTQFSPNINGGFGGGSSAHGNCCIGGGAGGGYGGGGATGSCQIGGGGGSYLNAAVTNPGTGDGSYNGSTSFNGYTISNVGYGGQVNYQNSFGLSGSVQITRMS